MNARELRQKFLEFFESKGHLRQPSGSLIPYDVTGRLDESLLFNGAGMVQFKPYFRGVAKPPSKRLTNVQKCVRTGDIEEIGDLTHLSFFEMLGNFSFGDYFKKEAIAYSWEFMTSPEWLGLDPNRLSFTVHEEDDESFLHWSKILVAAGLQPAQRVFKLGEDTNFWPAGSFSNGPPGPCGPNTEMFYWTPKDEPPPSRPDYTVEDWKRDEKEARWLEIWNDVFIQYEWKGHLRNPERPADGWVKDGMEPLPFASVDTGMGVERTATALGGFRSIYAIDVFRPVFHVLANLVAEHASEANPGPPATDIEHLIELWATKGGDEFEHCKAARIIVDHARTASFCIADGILPGNTGRGYVLRRLIRRAVLKGQGVLGFEKPFLWKVYEGVSEALRDHYTELWDRREIIVETLSNEEELFRRTLLAGSDQFQRGLWEIAISEAEHHGLLPEGASADEIFQFVHTIPSPSVFKERFPNTTRQFPGAVAFQLYDTYGFPLEVTQELCEEAGIEIDVEGFERAMAEAQERSRAAHGMESVYGGVQIRFEFLIETDEGDGPTPTRFVGYDSTEAEATIVGAMPIQEDGETLLAVALDRTPFYAESGGEVSDTGSIVGDGFRLEVVDLIKQDGIYVHLTKPDQISNKTQDEINQLFYNKIVTATVDEKRRKSITRNHTATHLLHAALRETLGKHVTQAGSLVAPDHLRFDFTHGKAMTSEEIEKVERMVNEQSLAAYPVSIHNDVPVEEAKKAGAMALFGEKYGDRVRMVEVPGISLELCGGCHVRNTAEIGLFKILHEASAASGVRRIEAVTGEKAYEWARDLERRTAEAAQRLKTSPAELVPAVERLQEQLREERKRIERLRTQSAGSGTEATVTIGSVELASQKLEEGDVKEATLVADRLVEGKPNRVAFVVLATNGKVQLVAKAGAEAVAKGAHAGNIVREAAKAVGGGGGGKPDFATAGGKDSSKAEEAFKAAEAELKNQLGAK